MAININKGSLCTLDVRNNYFGSNDGSVYNGLELTGELTDGSIIANNTFAKGFTTHNAINIYNVMNGATVYVNNNYCETVDFARIGIIGEPSCEISFNEKVTYDNGNVQEYPTHIEYIFVKRSGRWYIADMVLHK